MDRVRADQVYGMLRDAKFTRNQAKILALLDQVPDVGITEITIYLGMSSSRASDSLKSLVRDGYLMSMDVKYVMGKGRSRKIYRLRMPVNEIAEDFRSRVAIMISFNNMIDP
ncbi:MAG: hypothetical protein M1431_08030 [Candidatus Thermoplasmatota archaeon]|nr:hypothetical protein [Candidatus Thermoplasmatota archaeon]